MVIFEYNHAFTLQQLDLILTQYLELGPYYECLKKVLHHHIQKFEKLPLVQRHNEDKQHSIRLPINYYNYKSRQSGQIDQDSYEGQIHYIYPLTTIIEALNSNEFYLELPQKIIINNLLTTTNINIVIQTLKVVSQHLSKLIKSTLNSFEEKRLANYINTLVNDCLDGKQSEGQNRQGTQSGQKRMSLKELGFLGLLFEKGLKMINEQQSQENSNEKNHDKKDNSLNVKSSNWQLTQSQINTIKIDSVVQLSCVQSDQKIQSFANLSSNPKRNHSIQRSSAKRSSILASLLSSSDLNQQQTKNVMKTLKSLISQEKVLKPLRLIDEDDEQDKESSQNSNLHEQKRISVKKPKVFVQCEYCRDYRNYLLESTGLSYFDLQEISKISTETFNILKRIKNVTNIFTLYLTQTNRTTIPADLNTINKVLSNMNLIITEKQWQDEKLNPKFQSQQNPKGNKKTGGTNNRMAKHTLLTQLQPYFNKVYSYKAHEANEYTIDELLRMCLKAPQLKEIQKQLTQKYMNETRIKKQGKDIQTYCITKQTLNNNYLQLLRSKSTTNFNNDRAMLQMSQQSSMPPTNQLQLLKQYEKQQQLINRAIIHCKPMYAQVNQNYQEKVNLNSEIKKHKMQSMNKTFKDSLENSRHQKASQMKKSNQAHENQKFNMIMYHYYMKSQGFNVTKNNMSSIINQNLKSKNSLGNKSFYKQTSPSKNEPDLFNNFPSEEFGLNLPQQNATSNTLSSVHLKTEEQVQMNYDKKETEIYNKMLLNGETIRNQVLQEVEYGQAKIYESLDDFFREMEKQHESDNSEEQQEDQLNDCNKENLFLTLCGTKSLGKTTKKSTTPASLNTSTLHKTTKLQKKFSQISIEQQRSKNTSKKHTFYDTFTRTNHHQKTVSSQEKKQIKFFDSGNAECLMDFNDHLVLKKPQWINQYVEQTENTQQRTTASKTTNSKTTKTLLENRRYLEYQQKRYLQECLNKPQPQLSKSNLTSSFIQPVMTVTNVKNDAKSKTLTNSKPALQRPMSGIPLSLLQKQTQMKKSKSGTIKSLGRTLNGKKRSFLLSKDFVIQNNSLLTKIYQQNFHPENMYGLAREQAQKQKNLQQFNLKIQRSKFDNKKSSVQKGIK